MREHSRLRWVSDLINPATRTWDEVTIRKIFFHHDAEAVLALKLPPRATDDFVAWNCEDNGMFTVRSAYRLGLAPSVERLSTGQSSSSPSGDRTIWDMVWKAAVPPKICVFAWKAATNTLAVMENVHRRLITVPATCTVCGAASEDAHHALVLCTPARALRDQLRQVWALPPERDFIRTGEEWFLQLLANVPAETKPLLLFLFWRVWHHRNNIVHGDGKAPISASVPFLQNYAETFKLAASKQTDSKGKEKLFRMDPVVSDFSSTKSDWRPPNAGCTKVNVDGGWDWASKNAGWGMIVRDCTGNVKLSAWHHPTGCASAEQSEAIACLEGLKKIIHMRCWPAIIETDLY
jgi:hypothetical protein